MHSRPSSLQPPQSLTERLSGVVIAPWSTFEALIRNPRWADVLGLIFAAGAVAGGILAATSVGQLAFLDEAFDEGIAHPDHVAGITRFDLVILGRTVSDAHKLEAAKALRARQPNTPLLEICNLSPCVPNADHVLRSPNPEDLAEMVRMIFADKRAASEPS